MDLQHRSWLELVRLKVASSVDVCDKRLLSPENPALGRWLLAFGTWGLARPGGFAGFSQVPNAKCSVLALRLSANHLLHFALFRPARVLTGLLGFLQLDLLARCAFDFLA